MSILRYKDSWVKFTDCIEGMKELEDKSIDMFFTDPPWGLNYKAKRVLGSMSKNGIVDPIKISKRIDYKDNYSDEWQLEWFNEVMRICNYGILCIGRMKEYWWIRNTNPTGSLIIHIPNNYTQSKISRASIYAPYLIYGKLPRKLHRNVIYHVIKLGFLSEDNFLHPTPKDSDLWRNILSEIQPSSVLDPFMGSGTTLEACIQLDIPCYGFELMTEYRVDMEKRIERSKYYRKPRTLEEFI